MPCHQVVRPSWPIAVVSLLILGSGLQPLQAEPLLTQDAAQQVSPAVTAVSPLVELNNLTDQAENDLPLPQTSPPATTVAASQRSIGLKLPSALVPDTNTALRSSIKEAVRPIYNELAESGALDTWRDAKETLGLGHKGWERPGTEDTVNAREPESVHKPLWQDTTRPPKSDAQVQLDREYDAYLLRQLIDDLKPWVLGLIGLYALGYLTKLTFKFFQWKTARRRERQAQRVRHRSSRHKHRSSQQP